MKCSICLILFPAALVEYVKYVVSMSFDAKPNYKYCKRIFKKGVQDVGSVFDGKLSFEFNNARGVKRKKVGTFPFFLSFF